MIWEGLKRRLTVYCNDNSGAINRIATAIGEPRQKIHGYINYNHEPKYSTGTKIKDWLDKNVLKGFRDI